MKGISRISTIGLALVASCLVSAQEFNTSAPFNLQIVSSNETLNGNYLGACHAGAAIEQLCLAGKEMVGSYGSFHLNESDYNDVQGFLTGPLFWNLPVNFGNSTVNISSGMSFFYSPASNVAVSLFRPGPGEQYVGFDGDEHMFVGSYLDESGFKEGERPNVTESVPLYNWYVCWTYNTGYYYHALAWTTAGKPINPTCQYVKVHRKFVDGEKEEESC